MVRTGYLEVKDLSLDLSNFRTVAQKNELDAVKAMISISPDYFWGLMESLIDDGYLPTENILVIEDATGTKEVKEGNRRVASLKIVLGLIDSTQLDLPTRLIDLLLTLPSDWISKNSSVPCTIYTSADADVVDRIVTRTHGKGTKAGRDHWGAVARARHNRDKNGVSEPALDLLEKYLESGTNLTQEQRVRWAGNYVLSILDEAIQKTAQRFGAANSRELANLYPRIQYKKCLDEMILAIGMETLSFSAIRDSPDLALRFGVPPPTAGGTGASANTNSPTSNPGSSAGGTAGTSSASQGSGSSSTSSGSTGGGSSGANGGASAAAQTAAAAASSAAGAKTKTAATATNDERSVRRSLRSLTLFGQNRSKLVTLRQESLKLKIKDNPIAFCFLLRSMFEISAKAYCDDHAAMSGGPASKKADGSDRNLADVLKDIISHLTQNKANTQMLRVLHGPGTEILRPEGILSITSMNQLVHSPTFTIQPGDIPTLFANVFPLLDHMNK